jgi:hypothetical protein
VTTLTNHARSEPGHRAPVAFTRPGAGLLTLGAFGQSTMPEGTYNSLFNR